MTDVKLKNWAIRPSVGGVCVDGLRVDDASGIYWHSSSIVKRINGRLLETNSGSRYHLLGDMDEVYAKEVSDYLCSLSKQFKRGFPKKWKSLIEIAERLLEVKREEDKERKVSENCETPDNETPSRQNKTEGRQSYEMVRSARPGNCRMRKKSILSYRRLSKAILVLKRHSVTRGMTKKSEQAKMRKMSDSEGSHLDDTFNGEILVLRQRNVSLNQNVRKRKLSNVDSAAVSKKRKVEGHGVRQSLKPSIFPTPTSHSNDVLDRFSSRRTSLRKQRGTISTNIEPDILTLEGLLSPMDTSKKPRKMASSRRIIDSVEMPLDSDVEEDILQKSFLFDEHADHGKRQGRPRSQTVQPKLRRAPTIQRKSKSQAPSKSHNLRSRSPEQVFYSDTSFGRYNLRPRIVKKDITPGATTQGKLERLGSKSKCSLKQKQPSKNIQKTATVKPGFAQRMSENYDHRKPTVDKVKSTSNKDSGNRVRPKSGSRGKPVHLQLSTLNTEEVVADLRSDEIPKSITRSKSLASGDKLDIAKRSGLTAPKNRVQQKRSNVGLVENGHGVLVNQVIVQVKRIRTPKILQPKKPDEGEAVRNDATAFKLKHKEKDKVFLDSKHMEDYESRNAATVLELIQNGERTTSGKGYKITQGRASSITPRATSITPRVSSITPRVSSNITPSVAACVKSCERQVTETPCGRGKMQKSLGRRSVGQKKLKLQNKPAQVTPNVDGSNTNGQSLKGISVPVQSLKPKEKKPVVNKRKNYTKKENEGAAGKELNKIGNGERRLSTQQLLEQLEEKMRSKTKVISLLPANTEECFLTQCSEENLPSKSKVIQPKPTKKRKTTDGSRVIKQSQKSQSESGKEQKLKTSETKDSGLAAKDTQITNVKLLGGRGTLKREKELRKLVEKNMYSKDTNDFFSSTPFQSPRAKRFVFPEFEDDDDIFAGLNLSKGLNNEMTDVTPHGLFRVMDYTANKTPTTTPNTSATPAGIKRRRSDQDAYIHRVKKLLRLGQRKGQTGRNIQKKPQPASSTSRMAPMTSIDKDLFEVQEVREKDSEDEDYYFADD